MQEFYIMQEKEGRSHFLCVVVTYLTPHSSPVFSLLTPTFPPFTPSDLLLLLLLPSLLTSTHVHPNNSLVCVWGRRGRSQFTFSLLICVCVCVDCRIWVDNGRGLVNRLGGGCCQVLVWVKVDSSPLCGMCRSSRYQHMYVDWPQEAANICPLSIR